MNEKEMSALEFAFECHAGQVDKQGKPYILHVLRVAFANFTGCTENTFIAALLHDVVEDCGVKIGEIEAHWGVRIAEAVDHLSRRKDESYSSYIERVKEDHIAVRVKITDLIDNMLWFRIETLPEKERKSLSRRYSKTLAQLSAKDSK